MSSTGGWFWLVIPASCKPSAVVACSPRCAPPAVSTSSPPCTASATSGKPPRRSNCDTATRNTGRNVNSHRLVDALDTLYYKARTTADAGARTQLRELTQPLTEWLTDRGYLTPAPTIKYQPERDHGVGIDLSPRPTATSVRGSSKDHDQRLRYERRF